MKASIGMKGLSLGLLRASGTRWKEICWKSAWHAPRRTKTGRPVCHRVAAEWQGVPQVALPKGG